MKLPFFVLKKINININLNLEFQLVIQKGFAQQMLINVPILVFFVFDAYL